MTGKVPVPAAFARFKNPGGAIPPGFDLPIAKALWSSALLDAILSLAFVSTLGGWWHWPGKLAAVVLSYF